MAISISCRGWLVGHELDFPIFWSSGSDLEPRGRTDLPPRIVGTYETRFHLCCALSADVFRYVACEKRLRSMCNGGTTK